MYRLTPDQKTFITKQLNKDRSAFIGLTIFNTIKVGRNSIVNAIGCTKWRFCKTQAAAVETIQTWNDQAFEDAADEDPYGHDKYYTSEK